mmetsp:Transcript_52194/g.87032  ORF Transcript_52194/g.87032 Transcript_52194/m.87032 type:complete len:110 (-) Transcript_52194:1006-1335(-)
MASETECSDSASRALVASSRSRMPGFLTTALAMATRWRWPPLRNSPPFPTTVSYPSGICITKSWALACFAASSTCASEMSSSSSPILILSITEELNSTGFWLTALTPCA